MKITFFPLFFKCDLLGEDTLEQSPAGSASVQSEAVLCRRVCSLATAAENSSFPACPWVLTVALGQVWPQLSTLFNDNNYSYLLW